MTDTNETTVYTENSEFILNISPEFISSLSNNDRKGFRSELYKYPKEGLNYELFDKLSTDIVLEIDSNNSEISEYKGDFRWNFKKIDALEINSETYTQLIKDIITPEENISYEEAEAKFNGDPNLLIASMTLMAYNYKSLVSEIDYKNIENSDIDDLGFFKAHMRFTDSEEIVFLTGRTLLKEFNENSPNYYVQKLIKDIDSIVLRFNAGLIWDIANKYYYIEDNNDLFQEGTRGIARALKKFDIDKKKKFSTYATWWIRNFVTRYIKDNYSLIRIPIHLQDGIGNFKKARITLKQKYGEEPTFEETIEYCKKNGINISNNTDLLREGIMHSTVLALDKKLNNKSEDDYTLYDLIKDQKSSTEDDISKIENTEYIEKLYIKANLDQLETTVLNLFFGFTPNKNSTKKQTHTFAEISTILNLTRHKTYEIKATAIEKLKDVA